MGIHRHEKEKERSEQELKARADTALDPWGFNQVFGPSLRPGVLMTLVQDVTQIHVKQEI